MFTFIAIKLRTSFALFVTVALTLSISASATDVSRDFDQRCWSAVPLDLDTAREVLVDGPSGTNVFRIEIPSPGVLLPEVSEVFGSFLRPFVELVGQDCRSLRAQDVRYAERFPGRSAIKVNRPGTYHLRITTSPDADAGRYRLRVGFSTAVPLLASGPAAKDVEEWEEDDDGLTSFPKPVFLRLSGSAAKDVEEWEEDDDGLVAGTPVPCFAPAKEIGEILLTVDESGILALDGAGTDLTAVLESTGLSNEAAAFAGTAFGPSREILTRIDPGAYSLRWEIPAADEGFCGPSVRFYPICGLPNADDHGDTLACASEIDLGSEASGEIRDGSATDVDLFSFVLAGHARVVLETSGEVDTYLSVLDAAGRPLAADDDGGPGRSSLVEAELCPGRYFLRVEGVGGSEGPFVLATSTDPS